MAAALKLNVCFRCFISLEATHARKQIFFKINFDNFQCPERMIPIRSSLLQSKSVYLRTAKNKRLSSINLDLKGLLV